MTDFNGNGMEASAFQYAFRYNTVYWNNDECKTIQTNSVGNIWI